MDMNILIGLVAGIVIGYVMYYSCKQGLKDQIEDLQRGKERAERELEGAFDTISDLEHELVVKQNVINSLDERVKRMNATIKRLSSKS